MGVVLLDEAAVELEALPRGERVAVLGAIKKLRALGILLSAPHSSQVKGSTVRELRPRAGRSPWRAFYQRLGQQMVVAAIDPEAQRGPRGFRRSVEAAEARIAGYSVDGER